MAPRCRARGRIDASSQSTTPRSSAQSPSSASRPGPTSRSSRRGRASRDREDRPRAPDMASTKGAVVRAQIVPERGQP
eukprot:5607034-Pyramimonas_sp.AAC.2